jgi:hypothetical protein
MNQLMNDSMNQLFPEDVTQVQTYIATAFSKIIQEYGLTGKVGTVVTDNTSNMQSVCSAWF